MAAGAFKVRGLKHVVCWLHVCCWFFLQIQIFN